MLRCWSTGARFVIRSVPPFPLAMCHLLPNALLLPLLNPSSNRSRHCGEKIYPYRYFLYSSFTHRHLRRWEFVGDAAVLGAAASLRSHTLPRSIYPNGCNGRFLILRLLLQQRMPVGDAADAHFISHITLLSGGRHCGVQWCYGAAKGASALR